MVPQTNHRLYAFEGNQSFATLKLPLRDINAELFTKKQKTEKKPLTFPAFLPNWFR